MTQVKRKPQNRVRVCGVRGRGGIELTEERKVIGESVLKSNK